MWNPISRTRHWNRMSWHNGCPYQVSPTCSLWVFTMKPILLHVHQRPWLPIFPPKTVCNLYSTCCRPTPLLLVINSTIHKAFNRKARGHLITLVLSCWRASFWRNKVLLSPDILVVTHLRFEVSNLFSLSPSPSPSLSVTSGPLWGGFCVSGVTLTDSSFPSTAYEEVACLRLRVLKRKWSNADHTVNSWAYIVKVIQNSSQK